MQRPKRKENKRAPAAIYIPPAKRHQNPQEPRTLEQLQELVSQGKQDNYESLLATQSKQSALSKSWKIFTGESDLDACLALIPTQISSSDNIGGSCHCYFRF